MIDCSAIPLLKSLSAGGTPYWLRTEEGVVLFEIRRGEERGYAAACFFVSQEEEAVWKACSDMLSEAVRLAAGWVHGLYGFEMIAMELEQGIRNFKLGDLGQLLTNHARQMAVGESRLIRYGGLWGIFKKRVPENYGKIEFKSCVKICREELERFDLYLGAFARKTAQALPAGSQADLMACDLSVRRLLNPWDEPQQARLQAFYKKVEKRKPDEVSFSKIIYRHEREEILLWAKPPAVSITML